MSELRETYDREAKKRALNEEKVCERIDAMMDTVFGKIMFVIRGISDSQTRETTGFNMGGDLYLWPEEAWYLVNRGVATCEHAVEASSDIAAFYSHIRRDGLFLTRFMSFKALKDEISQSEPSSKHEPKRLKKETGPLTQEE